MAIGLLLWPVVVLAEPGDSIGVNVDQAKLVKLPTRVATIVVGNPLIADVTLQNGGIVVVTGKSYGATNFIAMDRSGEIPAISRMTSTEMVPIRRFTGWKRAAEIHSRSADE